MDKKTDRSRLSRTALVLMTVFSFSGLAVLFTEKFPNLASVTLIIGIVFYFVARDPEEKTGMSLKAAAQCLKDWKTDVLLLMPLLMVALDYGMAKLLLPAYLEHLMERIDFLSFSAVLLLLVELVVAALGEEIAWRGFFLNKLSKSFPFPLALLASACLFSMCHFTVDSPVVVLYDLLFIVIDAVFYGFLYKRTNNVLVCTLSHFLANLFGVFALLLVI